MRDRFLPPPHWRGTALLGLALSLAGWTPIALAQPQPPERPPSTVLQGTGPQSGGPSGGRAGVALPGAVEVEPGTLYLSAALAGETNPISNEISWRVFQETTNGALLLVARSLASAPSFNLQPGEYMVHAAYGLAGVSRRIVVGQAPVTERLTLSAGALKLHGQVGDAPIAPSRLSFSVYAPRVGNSEGRLIADRVKAGDVLRLPEGAYHVVSTYGDANAIVRTDLRVDNARLTEATLRHRAATVTLKLVTQPGGEAFANTAWSVLTPGGDVVRESVGAFSSLTLAQGAYTVIARHAGKIYTAEFNVQTGSDRDVEVLAR